MQGFKQSQTTFKAVAVSRVNSMLLAGERHTAGQLAPIIDVTSWHQNQPKQTTSCQVA